MAAISEKIVRWPVSCIKPHASAHAHASPVTPHASHVIRALEALVCKALKAASAPMSLKAPARTERRCFSAPGSSLLGLLEPALWLKRILLTSWLVQTIKHESRNSNKGYLKLVACESSPHMAGSARELSDFVARVTSCSTLAPAHDD